MIVMIILLSVLGLCVLLTVLSCLQIKEIPIYDKEGKYLAEYREFSDEDKEKIKQDASDRTRYSIGNYDEFRYTKVKYKIVSSQYGFDLDEPQTAWPFGISCVLTIACLATGIVCLCSNSTNRKQEIYTQYQMQINNLKQEAITIDNYLTGDLVMDIEASGSVYHVIVDRSFEIKESIVNYNKSVNSLKADLYMRKVRCSNPWTSWFWCSGAEMVEGYNKSATIYTDILPNLMTYEIKKV